MRGRYWAVDEVLEMAAVEGWYQFLPMSTMSASILQSWIGPLRTNIFFDAKSILT
jgi:hypothetical protein